MEDFQGISNDCLFVVGILVAVVLYQNYVNARLNSIIIYLKDKCKKEEKMRGK